jgi:outer membrane receptor for monomeric catechols
VLNLSFNQQFFYTRFGNPVTVEPTANGFVRPINAGAPLTTAGLDHYLRLDVSATEIYLGYTFVMARQTWVSAQPVVPLTPRHRFASVLAREFGKHFRTGIEASWTGKQVREDGSKTPSYLFMAAMMGWKFRHFDLILNGENLLDYRQTRTEKIVLGTVANPVFVPLWAPVDGRVINLAVVWRG